MDGDCGRGATPFRITFEGRMAQGTDELLRNIEANANYPKLTQEGLKRKPLAICGGGPSLAQHIDELKSWPGTIWAVNRTPGYLAGHGIGSVLVSVDALDDPAMFCAPDVVDGAIFSSWCAPRVVGRFPGVQVVDMAPLVAGGLIGCTTTAGSMAILGLKLGYTDISLFGLDGSFETSDHVAHHFGYTDQMIIRAEGQSFRTVPGFLIQCEELARIIGAMGGVLKERSGGLLRAIINDPDWSVAAVSGELRADLAKCGYAGAFDGPRMEVS